MATIKFRRGVFASIPTLAAGEPGWATDTEDLYMGTGSGNIKIAKAADTAIPSGLIAIFQTACPDGWTRVSAWDNKFLRGFTAYGSTGGTVQHRHSHDHPLKDTSYCQDSIEVASGMGEEVADMSHGHSFNLAAMQSSYATGNDHLPPYINVIFCKKD